MTVFNEWNLIKKTNVSKHLMDSDVVSYFILVLISTQTNVIITVGNLNVTLNICVAKNMLR